VGYGGIVTKNNTKDEVSQGPSDSGSAGSKAGDPVPMVALGASAGGLEPFEQFFDAMPVDSGVAFSIIQHLSPDFESMMDELLARHSTMNIMRVVDGLPVSPNTIYLNPPRFDMIVEDGMFRLSPRPKGDQLNLPIDIFFESLAKEYGEKSIAIILSGTGSDGTRGAGLIKKANGKVLVQEPSSAKFDGMPRSIIDSGNFDAIGAPRKLPEFIERIVGGRAIYEGGEASQPEDPAQHAFRILRDKFGTDFGYYKEATLRRRFERRAQLSRGTQEDYAKLLERDAKELDALYADLLIDVTSFFRDPKGFEAIKKLAIHPLGKKMTHDRQIRIWIPGCSSGEEAYSFAIAFADYARENNTPLNVKILATDIHQRSLGAASQGIYTKENLKGLSEGQIERYFEKHTDHYQISPTLRRLVVFSQHNLLRDPPFTRMDIVSCRNVLIYFLEEAQRKTIALFHFALSVDGFLFLGPSESLGHLEDEFETLDRRWNIFSKTRDVRLIEATSLLPRDSESSRQSDLNVPFLTGRGGTLQRFQRAHTEALELLVKQYAPSGFLLNKRGEVVHVFGEAGKYTHIDGGIFSNKIIDLIDPQLRLAVTTGLEQLSSAKKRHFERRIITTSETEGDSSVTVSLQSLSSSDMTTGHVVLTIAEASIVADEKLNSKLPKFLDTAEASGLLKQRITDLEADLQATEESLQSMVEELQTSNEELQATNEELMASNEELQSTNEELHSVNEELYTVSSEHQRKIDELTLLSDDMNHLLKATSIGIVFLDEHRRIRRFTPSATTAFNLLPQDVGRPFNHTTYRFDTIDLDEMMTQVEKSGKSIEQEIHVEGNEYFLSILPYKASVKDTSGIVMTLVDITEVKRTNEARLEEKLVFETAVNDLSQGILRVDLKADVVELFNDVAAGYYGKSEDASVGMKFVDFVGQARAEEVYQSIANRKAGESFTEQVVLQGGPQIGRVLSLSFRVIGDEKGTVEAFQVTSQDITEKYRYAEALEALISVWDEIDMDFDKAINGVLEIGCAYLGLPSAIAAKIEDKKCIVEYVHGQKEGNPKPGDVLQYRKTFCYHLPEDLTPLSISNAGDSQFKNKSCYTEAGIESYIGVRTLWTGGVYGAISFRSPAAHDREFTDMEKTMTQLLSRTVSSFIERKSQLEMLESRQLELEDTNEGLNRFTYLASHDLQEPLRKIQQSGELLEADYGQKLDEEGQYFLKIMTNSASRMRSLVTDLLLYSVSANETLETEWVSLNELVDRALLDLSEAIETKQATCNVMALPIAACDQRVMGQVFLNIIGNSLKYVEPNKKPKISITSKKMKAVTKIEIKDNGIGMDIKPHLNIFEPFTRLHSKSEYEGSGIGLAICKSICDRHGWSIEAKSEIGKGTTMILLIPNDDIQVK
jgi:two-component system CheB/CheR fusion protein